MQTIKKETQSVGQSTELLLKDEVYATVGAAIEVHRVLGPGFLEPVYQEALQFELMEAAIFFEADKLLPITYKGRWSKSTTKPT